MTNEKIISKEDLELKIKDLKSELDNSQKELDVLKKDFYTCQGRLKEIRKEKKELADDLKEFEMMKLDLDLLNAQKLQDDNNRIQHRIHITKKFLDEARKDIEFRDKVIEDLVKRKFTDRSRNILPKSYIVYKNK
ncbi:hypothetical protein [Methanobacterium alcaliphilum]|uniref:hypothetical protein n=1 Tax=Methanobacterium alcaliphilum TaxID=392018 RepID=UPI00200B6A21|nr:hypothetical protein [Methanobacterium alcaliphilum]MCK9150791.1 hypothetical protein [Methanobacterium alcaliphilum]